MTADPLTAEIERVQKFARRRWDFHAKRGDLTPVPVAFLNVGICLGVMLEGAPSMADGLESLARELRTGALNIERKDKRNG